MAAASPIFCITGATGYIASHVVQQLLAAGHTVRGTVRSLADKAKYAFLEKIAADLGAAERLSFFEADLLRAGSYDAAFEGVTYVIHMASPFIIGKVADPQKTFVDPAVQGTENVLASVAKSESVTRVVLTSSVAAIYGSPDDHGPDHTFTEADWNETSTLENGAYSLSKVLAEKKAWEIAKAQTRYTLVVINPSFVMGPTLTGRDDTASVGFVRDFLSGKLSTGVPEMEMGVVDVRDVAKAHVAGALTPAASGRYICSQGSLSMLQIAAAIREKYPGYPLPTRTLPKLLLYIVGPLVAGLSWHFITHHVGHPLRFDNSKITSGLGVAFERAPADTFGDMIKSMLDANLAQPPKA